MLCKGLDAVRKIEKILLINPFLVTDEYQLEPILRGGQCAEAPLGLCYLASYLKKDKRNKVKIYDANIIAIKHVTKNKKCDMKELWNILLSEIKRYDPDLVGVSCLFHSSSKIAHETCKLVKNYKDIPVIMGGCYPSISFKECLKDKSIDYVVFSEGEVTLFKLIQFLNGEIDFHEIDGIAHRNNNNVVFIPKKEYVNLDQLPWPDRSQLDLQAYNDHGRSVIHRLLDKKDLRVTALTASRGCVNQCTFCVAKEFWGRRLRYRSSKDVVQEMKLLYNEYGINVFILNDDNFTHSMKITIEFCNEIIKSNLPIKWLSSGGLEVVSLRKEETIKALNESGLIFYNLAIETGSQTTLRRIKKPLTVEIAKDVVGLLRKNTDKYLIGFFITGFPFETKNDIKTTLRFAGSLDLDWRALYLFQPFPGTALYDECVSKKYISKDLFHNESLNVSHSHFSTENFDAEWVTRLNYLANLKYNFIQSRNLEPGGNLHQAIRDFNYVTNFVEDHALGYYCLGKAYDLLDDRHQSRIAYAKVKNILHKSEEWRKHFQHFSISLDALQ